MRSLRSGHLPTILAVVAAFLVGLSSNRLVHESSLAAGLPTYYPEDSPPSWLGLNHPKSWGVAEEQESGVARVEGGELDDSLNSVSSGGGVALKGERETFRDQKMEEIIKVFG